MIFGPCLGCFAHSKFYLGYFYIFKCKNKNKNNLNTISFFVMEICKKNKKIRRFLQFQLFYPKEIKWDSIKKMLEVLNFFMGILEIIWNTLVKANLCHKLYQILLSSPIIIGIQWQFSDFGLKNKYIFWVLWFKMAKT